MRPKFFQVASINEQPVVIVAVLDPTSVNAIYQLKRKLPWISFIETSEEDAAKLLEEYGGIGAGCYLACSSPDIPTPATLAKLKLQAIAEHTTGLKVHKPIKLMANDIKVPVKTSKPLLRPKFQEA
jgi:hypothetical protein